MAAICRDDCLVFIDTNILLDFYRNRNDASLKLLERLEPIYNIIITSYIVEMEFHKNRLSVIGESIDSIKNSTEKISAPAFMNESKQVEILNKCQRDINDRIKKLKGCLLKIADNSGAQKDPVNKAITSLFKSKDTLYLAEKGEESSDITAQAKERFNKGYPPQKDIHHKRSTDTRGVILLIGNG